MLWTYFSPKRNKCIEIIRALYIMYTKTSVQKIELPCNKSSDISRGKTTQNTVFTWETKLDQLLDITSCKCEVPYVKWSTQNQIVL